MYSLFSIGTRVYNKSSVFKISKDLNKYTCRHKTAKSL